MAIDILQSFNTPPPALDFVLPGLLAGTVGALVSPGGAGKSMFALELSILIATGKDLTGFAGGNEYKQGQVAILATEDPTIALQHRLHALGAHLDTQQREQFAQQFLVEPVVGLGFDIADKDWRFYVETMAIGRRLLLIDTLRRFHNLDENSSSEMAYLLNTMENIAQKTNCAIVFLHHTNKSAAINGLGDMQQASRGSSVLVDNIRWQAFMSNCTKDEAKKYNIADDRRGYFVRCGVSKQNYGQPINDTWLRRVDGGVLTEAFLTETGLTTKKKGDSVTKHELTHARHDPAHCLAPGLFRSLQRGERKRSKLDVVYDYGDGKRIEFSGPEPLGADDLRILQGLVAMAGPSGIVLSPEPQTEAGKQLRLFLEPKWEAVQQDAMVVKGSYRALAREIGYANPDDAKPIRECIERLWKVSIIAQSGRKRQGFRLLSEYSSDEQDGKLYVALNPLIAQAVMAGGQHVRINMEEVRTLKADPARLMHQRLCGWIDPGKSGRVELDTLCCYVWPDEANAEAMKKRRQTARKALAELAAIGWTATEYAKGKWEISRPKAPHGNVPQPPR